MQSPVVPSLLSAKRSTGPWRLISRLPSAGDAFECRTIVEWTVQRRGVLTGRRMLTAIAAVRALVLQRDLVETTRTIRLSDGDAHRPRRTDRFQGAAAAWSVLTST